MDIKLHEIRKIIIKKLNKKYNLISEFFQSEEYQSSSYDAISYLYAIKKNK